MLRINILAVGRLRDGPESELFDRYSERLRKLRTSGLDLAPVLEVASGGGREAEGARQAARLGSGLALRLDERGASWSSAALAAKLGRWRDADAGPVTFLVGGAEGYGREVTDRVPDALSFGTQTWPHRLVRVMLAEQLYRAAAILSGSPYHKA